jgi:hypothetical protein
MVYIIVEGITDKALIKRILLDFQKEEKKDFEFLGLKGISSVKAIIKNLTEHDLSQNKYFAIVDADASFKIRNEEMESLTKGNLEFYIFPNHKDNGDLETLLLSNIDKENSIIKCFDEYQRCVNKDIDSKAKLYAYTTLQCHKKPEEYIETLDKLTNFDTLKQKLQNLFN